MLTSAGSAALEARACRGLRGARWLKPVKQSELLDAIVTAFAQPNAARRPPAKQARRIAASRARRCDVLVAEDNPTNQTRRSLRLLDQQGHHVAMVNNGRLAPWSASRRSRSTSS